MNDLKGTYFDILVHTREMQSYRNRVSGLLLFSMMSAFHFAVL